MNSLGILSTSFGSRRIKILLPLAIVGIIGVSLLSYGAGSFVPSSSVSQSNHVSAPISSKLAPRTEIAQQEDIKIKSETSSVLPTVTRISSNGAAGAEFVLPTIFNPAFAISPTQTSVSYQDWAIPSASSLPYDLEVDKTLTKYVYFGEQIGKIARLDTSNNIFTEWNIPTAGTLERNVFVDSLGSVWFAEAGNQPKIGKLVPSTNQITEWSFSVGVGGPIDVVVDPSGNVWWTAQSFGGISKLNPSTNTLTRYIAAGTTSANAFGITADSSGLIYISDPNSNQIVRFDPTTNKFTMWVMPVSGSNPNTAAFDSTGNLWFAELGNRIGKLDPSTNDLTEYPVPTPNSGPSYITIDSSNTVFFSENLGNKIGRLDPTTNTVTEWSIAGSKPLGVGTDGTNLYIAENNANKIGRLN